MSIKPDSPAAVLLKINYSALFPAIATALLVVSCSTPEVPRISEEVAYEVVDMSGHWEKDYQLSDDFETEFNLYVFDVQRRLNPQSDGLNRNTISSGVPGGSMESVVGLARFTEEITRMPVLEIRQDRSRISIDREEDFALFCEFFNRQVAVTETPFGNEQCGWNGEQLLFQLNLTDGLRIFYQVTLSPNGRQLNITTTVSSSQVSTPITISNYYRRYEVPETDIDCILTLTRNNVCRRKSPQVNN